VKVLQKLEPQNDPRLLAGTAGYEDAGVFQLDEGRAIVQTVDFFPPIVDDPRWFGRIAAANALSDVFAMGGECLTALNLVGWPDELPVDLLGEVMAGGQDKVIEAGAVLCGGHSVQMPSVLYGMSVTGEVDPKRFWRNSGAQEGDRLILTKPLGIGIVSTAMKKGRSNSELDAAALTQMATLNQHAAKAMAEIEVHAATDVTGFGIMGHGGEMAEGAGLSLEIDSAALPLFPGSLELARGGLLSGGSKRGQLVMEGKFSAEGVDEVLLGLMFDAETSGGLLLAVAEQDADHAVERLRDAGALSHAIVGGFSTRGEVQIRVS
jgi:selenide,water dikinase